MLKLLFRTGFPQQCTGLYKLYVFEIMLNDGTTRDAVVAGVGHDDDVMWAEPKTLTTIDTVKVLGWRETYNCDAARQDIDAYFKDPVSIVAKDHLGDAFARHITREPCSNCREYFEEKQKPVASTTAG